MSQPLHLIAFCLPWKGFSYIELKSLPVGMLPSPPKKYISHTDKYTQQNKNTRKNTYNYSESMWNNNDDYYYDGGGGDDNSIT